MKEPVHLPTWAPRVKPYLIRQLYENDAQSLLDRTLMDKVGWALHARCDSFLLAREASQGRVHCPACGTTIQHDLRPKRILCCPTCEWSCAWKDFAETIRNQQLHGGPEVIALFQACVDQFPKAKTPTEKMLLIDGLIHGFHHYLRSGRTRRPVGINLIDGHLEFVIDFLDRLSTGPGSTPGLQQTQAEWRERILSTASESGQSK